MLQSNDQVAATRTLLREVCALIAEHVDDAVLVGGWVPDILFPDAIPRHIGSIDVDLAMRLRRESYDRLVSVLRERGFHQGENGYQFFRTIQLADDRIYHTRLDLLTSRRHREDFFPGAKSDEAPEPVPGAELAFTDNSVVSLQGGGELRVAGIVAFLVMKSLAMHARDNGKDPYDIHFCLENYPSGLPALAELFRPWRGDPLVEEGLQKMAAKFKSDEDDGCRVVADVEHLVGESRSIRKLQVAIRVQEFLGLILR